MQRLALRVLLIVIGINFSAVAWAGDSPKDDEMRRMLTAKSFTRCDDYYYNATILIPRLYAEQKKDSLYDLLDFWEKECGSNSRIRRVRIICAIREAQFSEKLYDSAIISDLISLRDAREWILKYGYSRGRDGEMGDYARAQKAFDEFVTEATNTLLPVTNPVSVERFFMLFFNDQFDSALTILKTQLGSSNLKEYYDIYLYKLKKAERQATNYAMWAGAWLPQGDNKVLGNHPEFSFVWGREERFGSLDMAFAFRTGKSKNPYDVKINDSIVTTRDHLGFYLGFDYGYQILSANRLSTDLQLCLGLDQINSAEESEDKAKTLGAFVIGGGVRQRFYFGKYKEWYTGVQLRYYYPFRSHKEGTSLKGGSIGASIIIGFLDRGIQKDLLRMLGQ